MNDIEADLLIANAKIKQLEEQLADYHHMSELVDGKMEENQRLRRINENLQEQLAASQHRERAAVEDISRVAYRQKVMPCAACAFEKGANHWDPCSECSEIHSHFVWRGPQEAGEGA